MRTPRVNWPFFVVTIMVTLAALAFLMRDREPSYASRSLSAWLVALTDYSPDGDPEPAEAAIRQIGTNAIPFLVRYGSYSPPFLQWRLSPAMSALGSSLGFNWGRPFNRAEARGIGAIDALGVLGPEAVSTIPELTRWMNSPKEGNRATHATFALGHIGGQALLPLITALTNPKFPFRGCAALSLSLLGTNARPAVPILIEYLCVTNELAECAAMSLGKLQQEPQLVVPALMESLNDPRLEVRRASAQALEQFGVQARSAQPALLSLLDDTLSQVREGATNALQSIAPEAFTNALLSVKAK